MTDTSDLQQATVEQHITAEHSETFPATKALPEIELAIRALVPSRRYAEIVALFDNRAPYSTIQCWRNGRRSTPQWALDLAAEKIARIGAIESILRRAKTGPGKRINTRNLMAWHARNKDKKEKTPD